MAMVAPLPPQRAPEATAEQKERAEALKNTGNIAVREERLHDAVESYTKVGGGCCLVGSAAGGCGPRNPRI